MVATERVLEYTKLPPESALMSSKDVAPADDWPQKGSIVFDKMSFGYSIDSQVILDKISCKIEGGHKVTLVIYSCLFLQTNLAYASIWHEMK